MSGVVVARAARRGRRGRTRSGAAESRLTTIATTTIATLAALPALDRERAVAKLNLGEREALDRLWQVWAHAGQIAPAGDWRVWLIRAGRGFGKTRAGAQWVIEAMTASTVRVALVGATLNEARRVMVEGESGLLSVARAHVSGTVTWRRSDGVLTLPNGSSAQVYSADRPDGLRGPQHDAAWCDEIAKWRYGEAAWDNLLLGLRLGTRPRVVVTTTPAPVALVFKVMAAKDTVQTTGRTCDNPHVAPDFAATMHALYAGRRLERQELDGELIDEHEGALWPRKLIERQRLAGGVPALVRVVVGVDPPAGGAEACCGIVAVGLGEDGHAYVLEDASVATGVPERWAAAVAACAARHRADRVIAEVNQGGAMVTSTLLAADARLPVQKVHATRGKVSRAEPVSVLYERGEAWHAGRFDALEDQMAGLMAGGDYVRPGRSPDRADALVWALTGLMLRRKTRVGVRAV